MNATNPVDRAEENRRELRWYQVVFIFAALCAVSLTAGYFWFRSKSSELNLASLSSTDVVELLANGDPKVGDFVMVELIRRGPDSCQSIEMGLRDSRISVRRRCAIAAGELRCHSESNVALMISWLNSEHAGLRIDVMHALSSYGAAATIAVPAIVAAVNDRAKSPFERRAALLALGRIREPIGAVLPTVRAAFLDSEFSVAAADALAELGAGARPARADLEDALDRTGDLALRAAIQRALSAIDAAR